MKFQSERKKHLFFGWILTCVSLLALALYFSMASAADNFFVFYNQNLVLLFLGFFPSALLALIYFDEAKIDLQKEKLTWKQK